MFRILQSFLEEMEKQIATNQSYLLALHGKFYFVSL